MIMAVDHFLLPRIFRISRPLTRVPTWAETGAVNVPAVVALLASVAFGVVGLAALPSGWLYSSPPNGWGPVPLEAWLLSGILYVAGVAIARIAAPDSRAALGFASFVREGEGTTAAVDIANPSHK